MDRLVECGGCDTRFRINDDVIIRSRKFYPGERTGPELQRFQRVPLPAANLPEGIQPMRYEEFNHPEQLGPASPQRIIAGILGVSVMAITAMLMLFSSSPGASLSVMPFESKLMIAGFVSIVGVSLLIYANPRARIKATLVSIALSAGVISIPFFVKSNLAVEATVNGSASEGGNGPFSPKDEIDPIAELRKRFTTAPLEKEQQRLEGAGDEQKAFGIYITNMIGRNKYTARDYLIRDAGAGFSSHLYPRDNDNYLMILTGVEKNIEEVAKIAGRLGRTEEIHPEIGVVVVSVENNQFLAGSAEKLNDRSNPAFYDLNRRELESIDLDRVNRAVDRLADAEPSLYRTDITLTLIGLLTKSGVSFHDSISRALLKWAEDPNPAAEAGLEVIQGYGAKNLAPPEELVTLIAKAGNPEAVPAIIELWIKNPVLWNKPLVKFGSAAEPLVLDQIDAETPALRRSAVEILGQIGTEESLVSLRETLMEEDPELQVLAERAIRRIQER